MTHSAVSNRHNGALGSSRPSDVVISADGSRIYASGPDGAVRVYHGDTGELLATWQVGTRLGGIDLSPDGQFLLVLEAEPVSSTYAPYWWDNRFTVAVHKVETGTGAVTTFLHQSTGSEWAFHDVAIMANGTALLTQKILPGWSGWATPEVLNTSTGVFTSAGVGLRHNSTLSDSPSGQTILIGESNISDAPLRLYASGAGFTALHNGYRDNVMGFNTGVQALSGSGLVAQHVPGNGLHIYDPGLSYQRNLAGLHPGLADNVAGLAFDSTGAFLFVLDGDSGSIIQLSTSDWSLVRSIPVGADLTGNTGDLGSRLIVGPNMRYFTVVTNSGLLQIDNPNVSATLTGTGGDDALVGTGLHDVLQGLGGNDNLDAMGGADVIEAGSGDDHAFGGDGDDEIEGGEGNDFLAGQSGADSIDGGEGDDFVVGGEGDDVLLGGAGQDSFRGDDGNDGLSGGADNDNLRGGRGVDSFDGGTGGETLDSESTLYGDKVSLYEQLATQGAVADLRTGIISNDGFGNVETMTNIESLGGGTAFADSFYGNDGINGLMGSIGDFLHGFGGDDHFDLTGAPALTDGGEGIDAVVLRLDEALQLPGPSGLAELMDPMTAGWMVDLAAGTLRDGYGNAGAIAGVENLVGSDLADDLRGNGSNNAVAGGGGADVFRLHDGGDDSALGGGGNDQIFYGAAFTAADSNDGGAGTDVVILQGNYTLTLGAGSLTNVEYLSLQSGSSTRYQNLPVTDHAYDITSVDSNVAAGQRLIVNASQLLDGESFTFDGSAESDGSFLVYGGFGADVLTGGSGHDVFHFEGSRWGSGDAVDGGAGADSVVIRAGAGTHRIEFGETQLIGVESISVSDRFGLGGSSLPSYEMVLANGNVAAGATLIVNASTLLDPAQTLSVDGSAVSGGHLKLYGGAGGDTLIGGDGDDLFFAAGGADRMTGGEGRDTFQLRSLSDSPASGADHILDFVSGTDKIDLRFIDADSNTAGDQAFAFVGAAFTGNGTAGSGAAGELRAYQDSESGAWIVEGDVNGDGNADFRISVVSSGPLLSSDFIA